MKFFEKPCSLSIKEIFKEFRTSEEGLTSLEVNKRQKIFGKNEIEEEKISRLKIFVRQFSNVLVYILLFASRISFFAERWVDFFTIIIIVIINSFVGYWQEIKAEMSIRALKKLTESKEKVIRDGKIETLPSNELVPGDLILLFEGSVITSDIRLVEASSLMIDEASITGESIPVEKDHLSIIDGDACIYEQTNMAFTGTTVVRGAAKGIVTKTGKDTYFNTIAKRAKEPSPESPLTKAVKFFAKNYIIYLICILFFLGVYGYYQGRSLFEISYILIAELVSVVPEGLPIVVTLVMVIGALALSKQNTLVRYLPAVETLGSATIIASDKTGTITEGIIEVKEVFALDEDSLRRIAGLCNDSHGNKGDPIDVALSLWSGEIFREKDKYPRIWGHAFDSKLRLMATAHKFNGTARIFVKGAFEPLKKMALNSGDFALFEKYLEKFSREGLRVLAFGEGEFTSKNVEEARINIVGLIGFLDPPKKEVRSAVVSAQKAGIKVMMITGDYLETAKAVASDVGIYRKGDIALTGENIDKLSEEELLDKLKSTTVIARALPEHKYKLVKILQQKKEVVAVTGDGVNDVPALKRADLGIAMGSGTEAAKSVSKMVITDSNLKVIVEAIRNGRVIGDNIRKVIYYLLSTSMMEITLISFAIFLGLPLPLSPIQILWINLITDGVQDKTFPFAKEEGNVMNRPPRKANKQFFDSVQMLRVLFFGFPMGVLILQVYMYLLKEYTFDVALTISFTCVVVAQWINGIQAQTQREPYLKNIKKSVLINPYIFVGISLGVILQIFAIYAANGVFQTVPLAFEHWKYVFFIVLASFFIVEIRKWLECAIIKIADRRVRRRINC